MRDTRVLPLGLLLLVWAARTVEVLPNVSTVGEAAKILDEPVLAEDLSRFLILVAYPRLEG